MIALPLGEYVVERNPVLKLWHACDVVELLLRMLVTMGFADLRRIGQIPQSLTNELRSRIEEPTLGKWKGMATAIADHVSEINSVIPELPGLIKNTLLPLLDGHKDSVKTANNSLVALRNQLAHGGGITKAMASRLVEQWQQPFTKAVNEATWLAELDLVVRTANGRFGVLRGPTTKALPYTRRNREKLEAAFVSDTGVVLVRDATVLPLWPLILYGIPRNSDPSTPALRASVPQLYVRRGEVCLQFTALGSEEVCQSEADEKATDAFLIMFRLDEAEEAAKSKSFVVRGFEVDIRKDAERLVGRKDELDKLRAAISSSTEGVIWVWGPAGIGKSFLIARLTADVLIDSPFQTLVLPFRFKVGDDRCTRESFLRFAIERLEIWLKMDNGTYQEGDRHDARPLDRLREILRSLQERHVLFVLDGMDEIVERDPHFVAEVPLALREIGVTWLCAGRPEAGTMEAFNRANAANPFPEGLPPMGIGDIRTMLLEKIGPLRKRLLENDRQQGELMINPFIERVAELAKGLPLYVKYVVGDILNNRFRALDAGERLPPSLEAYHEELLHRCAISTQHQTITPLAVTLAAAKQPLPVEVLAALLHRRTLAPEGERGVEIVQQCLSAIAPMLRRAVTSEGTVGYTLFHHSLRQHISDSEATRGAIDLAREEFCHAALSPVRDKATQYIYRHGIAHLIEMAHLDEALCLLIDFTYLMARLRTIPDPDSVNGLAADWHNYIDHVDTVPSKAELWEAFFREREHILRRGERQWPAYKIMFQLAVEYGDDSL